MGGCRGDGTEQEKGGSQRIPGSHGGDRRGGAAMDPQQPRDANVERFLKLGYPHGDIVRVLESLRHDAQTNDILEELIKTCRARPRGDKGAPGAPGSPKLVPRGCSPGPVPARPRAEREPGGFRRVVIDGSNVAMSHGDKKVFSCRGLLLAVNWFWDKGVRDITVFVPLWRKEQPRPEAPITDQHILHELESRKILVFTPSRHVNGKRVVCYDDRYIIKLAVECDGIIVSNDNYRDLQMENLEWKKFIEERLLMYTFANDKFMPPDDPLGRNGPTIDDFLRKKPWTPDNKLQHCPYGKKCTYGVKCKFYHPERVNQSQLPVADELRAQRNRARNHSPKHIPQDTYAYPLDPRYTPSTTPPLSKEDHGGSGEHQRDSVSPRSQPATSCHHGPSLDADEAFGSMESSLSRLYIQDTPYTQERHHHSYSSGVNSCSLSHDDYSHSGSYNGNQCSCGGAYPPQQNPPYSQCRYCYQQPRSSSRQHQQPWSSCPALPPQNRDHPGHYSEKQHFRQPSNQQTRSLSWDPRASSRGESPRDEQRTGLKQQLSTLFPQNVVEQVMNAYPHISDMCELISLIQSYRTSHITY